MITDLDFMDGYPHLSLISETAQDRAWLTKFMENIAKRDDLSVYYWPILICELVAHDPDEMTLGMYRDYVSDGEHSILTVKSISFRTICSEYDEFITPDIRSDMAKLMKKTANMLLNASKA